MVKILSKGETPSATPWLIPQSNHPQINFLTHTTKRQTSSNGFQQAPHPTTPPLCLHPVQSPHLAFSQGGLQSSSLNGISESGARPVALHQLQLLSAHLCQGQCLTDMANRRVLDNTATGGFWIKSVGSCAAFVTRKHRSWRVEI